MILTPDDQVHPDTHAMTMVNNVIEVVNYVIAARLSLRNFMIADSAQAGMAANLLVAVRVGSSLRCRRCTWAAAGFATAQGEWRT